MANITKQKRDEMLAFLEQLKADHNDDASIRAFNEIQNHLTEKKFGLVFEEHTEEVDEKLLTHIPVLCADKDRRLCKDESKPWNFLIEGDNLQALYLLEKTHRGKVDCIYIDPPYNSGATDWKYNNDYVEETDVYRHSKWLSMMKERLLIARRLLNPANSMLICTIDEKEYLHLGCLLEELFPNAKMQMVSSIIKNGTSMRQYEFSRCNEYLFFLRFGNAVIGKEIPDDVSTGLPWRPLMRSGTGSNNFRPQRPNSFYPIYVDTTTGLIHSVGEAVPMGKHAEDVPQKENCVALLPLKKDGTEMVWGSSSETLMKYVRDGYAKATKSKGDTYTIKYLTTGVIKEIEQGKIEITGRDFDNSVIGHYVEGKSQMPQNQWDRPTHNASEYGTNLIKSIIGKQKFTFPKSLYAVSDCIRFAVKNKPNAIIIDFFAGSGTTQHAVNLLNMEDGGNRRCIMVTNNEISAEEEKRLISIGHKKGDEEWEALGIAKHVTWPRTECSINGVDITGAPLKGEYLTTDIDGNAIPMSQGFMCNVKYFKCDWTPRKPEDYLLSNALCLHIREMIELQNHIEIDNKKYVLILNKSDFNKYVMDPEAYEQIEQIWVNQSIVLNSEELKLLRAKGFKYIPREYFGQELREAAE